MLSDTFVYLINRFALSLSYDSPVYMYTIKSAYKMEIFLRKNDSENSDRLINISVFSVKSDGTDWSWKMPIIEAGRKL